MGREVLAAVCREPGLEAVAAVEQEAERPYLDLPDGSGSIPFSSDLASLLETSQPDVLVDFTTAAATMPAARAAAGRGVGLVIGTTGLSPEDIGEIEKVVRANKVGAVMAPNFSLGAVMMVHLAKVASRYFDHVEVVEMHHEQKADAPSGTAISTAREMARSRGADFSLPQPEKETLQGSRGAEMGGVALHSIRLPGLMAHQEVIFGAPGQTLRIRHDTISRECYMPGVVLAIKRVVGLEGLVFGLDALLGLQE